MDGCFGPEAAVRAHLNAENARADEILTTTQPLQQRLYDEFVAHVEQTDLGVPHRRGAYEYYVRKEEARRYPVHLRRRQEPAGPEEIVLDLDALAGDSAAAAVTGFEVSDDGTRLAFLLDVHGDGASELRVLDIGCGRQLVERIFDVGSVAWAAGTETLFYVTADRNTRRRDTLWRLTIGGGAPVVVRSEPDPTVDLSIARSRDGTHLLLGASSKTATEWCSLDASKPLDAFALILGRERNVLGSIEIWHGRYLAFASIAGGEMQLYALPSDGGASETWDVLVPARADRFLDEVELFADHAVLKVRVDGYLTLEVLDLATSTMRAVALPEKASSVMTMPNPEYHARVYDFKYASLVSPVTIYSLDLRSLELAVRKKVNVPGYDSLDYESTSFSVPSWDGTLVPVSVVRRKDSPAPAPMLLTGYGAYGLSMDPLFSAERISLLDRGFVFAIAHVRGGGELGRAWHASGSLREKSNSFRDFIAVAEHFVDQNVTSPELLAAQGTSAGGLLVCASANFRPTLFRAVVAQSPFVDVLNTMLDPSLPLTTLEYLEWGDPRDCEDFAIVAAYSPYDNIDRRAYPAMLITVSLNDGDVPFWEGAKYAARVRDATTSQNPVLLCVSDGLGHLGATARLERYREIARVYAFLITQLVG